MIPPKPAARADRVSLWEYGRLFRQDILSAQPARLYRAKMAEFRTPFFRSFLLNDPDLVRHVLCDTPLAYPKSDRIARGLRPLLGQSVFLTNGAQWQAQRRVIDPAFAQAGVRHSLPAMLAAADVAAARFAAAAGTTVDVDAYASRATADVIFRTLFSRPITDALAAETYDAFRAFQRCQPIVTPGALLPRLLPVGPGLRARRAARRIRRLIQHLTQDRMAELARGTAPDDLATRLLRVCDPQTGAQFSKAELVDQVAIFFLAGHETSAATLAWALYLVAAAPDWQTRIVTEATPPVIRLHDLGKMRATRDVLRETLRLYPPVPMMVREATAPTRFRDRHVPKGAQLVISPWHLHRNERLWANPDHFDPGRWQRADGCPAAAYIPFSAGPRICPGAGFAMAEAQVLLSRILRRVQVVPTCRPMPVAHLTLRARDGIRLAIEPRA
ncbi:MAG: cytochrome P450 [Primorskyibacter sp.]